MIWSHVISRPEYADSRAMTHVSVLSATAFDSLRYGPVPRMLLTSLMCSST